MTSVDKENSMNSRNSYSGDVKLKISNTMTPGVFQHNEIFGG